MKKQKRKKKCAWHQELKLNAAKTIHLIPLFLFGHFLSFIILKSHLVLLVPERVIRFLAPFVHLLLSHLLFTHLFLHRLMVLHLVAAHVQLIHHLVILVVVLNLVAETLLVLKLLLRHLSRNHIIMRFLMPLFILPCLLFLYRLQTHPVFVAVGLALFAHLFLNLFTAV